MGEGDGQVVGSMDDCDDTVESLKGTIVGLLLGSTDGSLEDLNGNDCCSTGLKDKSLLDGTVKAGSNNSGSLGCTVGVKVGLSEMNGWSMGSQEGVALVDS